MKYKTLAASVALFIVSLLLTNVAGAASDPDTFIVRNLTFVEKVASGQLHGLELKFQLEYHPASYKASEIQFFFALPDNSLVQAHASSEDLRDAFGHLRLLFGKELARPGKVQIANYDFVLPYSAIALPADVQTIKLVPKLKKTLRDEAIEGVVSYEGENTVTFQMPPTTQVKLQVKLLEVNKTNLDGKPWDNDLLGRDEEALPDLRWSLKLEGQKYSDELYHSTVVQNAYRASWPDASSPFYMSEGDKVGLYVEDQDKLGADRIGLRYFTLEELEQLAKDETPLKFDRVKTLVFGPIMVGQ